MSMSAESCTDQTAWGSLRSMRTRATCSGVMVGRLPHHLPEYPSSTTSDRLVGTNTPSEQSSRGWDRTHSARGNSSAGRVGTILVGGQKVRAWEDCDC